MLDRPLPLDSARGAALYARRHPLPPGRVPPHGGVRHRIQCPHPRRARRGSAPVLAHPERYRSCSPEAVAHWRELGADAGGRHHAPRGPGPRPAGPGLAAAGWRTSSPRTTMATTGPRGRRRLPRAQDGASRRTCSPAEPGAILADGPLLAGAPLGDRGAGCRSSATFSRAANERAAGTRRACRLAIARASQALGPRVAALAPRYAAALRAGGTSSSPATAAARPTPSTSPPNTWSASREPPRPCRHRAHHRHLASHRRRQRPGLRADVRPADRSAGPPGRSPGAAQHQRREPQPARRGAGGAGAVRGVVAFLGRGGGPLAAEVDEAIVIPSEDTSRIQELHLALEHLIVEAVEEELGADDLPSPDSGR